MIHLDMRTQWIPAVMVIIKLHELNDLIAHNMRKIMVNEIGESMIKNNTYINILNHRDLCTTNHWFWTDNFIITVSPSKVLLISGYIEVVVIDANIEFN